MKPDSHGSAIPPSDSTRTASGSLSLGAHPIIPEAASHGMSTGILSIMASVSIPELTVAPLRVEKGSSYRSRNPSPPERSPPPALPQA